MIRLYYIFKCSNRYFTDGEKIDILNVSSVCLFGLLFQIDVLEDSSIQNVIILQTVLEEVCIFIVTETHPYIFLTAIKMKILGEIVRNLYQFYKLIQH